ncbi:MAG: ribosome biogenesis GTPase Der [Phycisphaerales bacterium]
MPLPRIAIVGRPNVGKSSLLNMMAGKKVSIVDPTPGTTRDRVSIVVDVEAPLTGEAEGGPMRAIEVIDTGGFGAYVAQGERYNEIGADLGSLATEIEEQIAMAVSEADLILFCVDAQAGITPLDQEIARRLREGKLGRATGTSTGKKGIKVDRAPVVLVATKVDGPRWEAHGYELAGLGFGEPILVSAMNNYFRREFLDAVYRRLPPREPDDETPVDMRLAIIGKRNAGKSSLVNALAGQKRVIVSEIAGTTRDAVDVRMQIGGRSLLVIDTAGLRRKKSFANQIEWWAYDRAKRAIDRADAVLLLVDATEETSQVDEQLAMLVQKAYKPCVIVVNKWDLVEGRMNDKGKPISAEDYETYLRKEIKGLVFAPISLVSAEKGLNLRPTIDLAFEVLEQSRTRVGTGRLNRLIEGVLETSNPPSKLGTRAKVYYVAQVAAQPPTIVLVVNKPELFTANYLRFLENRLREELPFAEVPMRLIVRGKRRVKGGGIDPSDDPLSAEEAAEAEREALEAAAEPEGDEAEAYFEE